MLLLNRMNLEAFHYDSTESKNLIFYKNFKILV